MSAKKLLAIAVASIMLIGTAAAVGAAAPADQAHENATTQNDDNATVGDDLPTDDTDVELPADGPEVDVPGDDNPGPADTPAPGDGEGAADRPGTSGDVGPASDGVGPAGGLPSVVPDHVSEIHDTIGSFLGGSVENLGDSLSDLLGGDSESAPAENSTVADQP